MLVVAPVADTDEELPEEEEPAAAGPVAGPAASKAAPPSQFNKMETDLARGRARPLHPASQRAASDGAAPRVNRGQAARSSSRAPAALEQDRLNMVRNFLLANGNSVPMSTIASTFSGVGRKQLDAHCAFEEVAHGQLICTWTGPRGSAPEPRPSRRGRSSSPGTSTTSHVPWPRRSGAEEARPTRESARAAAGPGAGPAAERTLPRAQTVQGFVPPT